MEREQAQREIRNALNMSDELGRHAQARHSGDLPYVLAALRTTLDELDRQVGGYGVERPHLSELRRLFRQLGGQRNELGADLASRVATLVQSIERVQVALTHPDASVPSKRVLVGIPLARAVPHEAHTAIEVAAALAAGAGLVLGAGKGLGLGARVASGALMATSLAVTAATDARASAVKVIPVEAHARFDVAWGLVAVALPFALGYARSLAGKLTIAAGASVLAVSMLTDYRATRGLVRPQRSRGGPHTH